MPIILDEQSEQKTKPLIESSHYRSYKAYVDAGFKDIDIPRKVIAPYLAEKKFLSKVNLEKGPLTRKIRKMIRQKVNNIEYLTYTEDWNATDWLGRNVSPVSENLEGVLLSPKMDPVIDEKGQRIGKEPNGQITKYEILFSKETVDKLLEETGTSKEETKFTVRGPNTLRGECESYEQFIYPWNQAVDTLMKDGGFQTDYVEGLKRRDTSQQSKSKT